MIETPQTDDPRAEDMLLIAHHTLATEIMPAVSGVTRYQLAMATRVLRLLVREAAQAQPLSAVDQRLASYVGEKDLRSALRDGALDADPALHALLTERALRAAAITRPSLLTAAERARIGADCFPDLPD